MTTANAPPGSSRAPFDVAIASSLASRMSLRDILFAAIEARVLNPIEEGAVLDFDTPVADVRWHRDGADLRVIIPYRLNVEQRDGEGKPFANPAVAEILVLLRIDYAIGEGADVTETELHHFVGISAFMHSWPYFRAEVEALTTKLRLPPLVLPLVVSGNASDHFRVSKLQPPDEASARAPAISIGDTVPPVAE